MLSNYYLYRTSLALKSTIIHNLSMSRAVQWEWSGRSMRRTWECQDQSTMGRIEAERVCDYLTLEPAPASQQEQLSLTFKTRRLGKCIQQTAWVFDEIGVTENGLALGSVIPTVSSIFACLRIKVLVVTYESFLNTDPFASWLGLLNENKAPFMLVGYCQTPDFIRVYIFTTT